MRNYQILHSELERIEAQMNRLETYSRWLERCLGAVLILTAGFLLSGWRTRERKRTLSPEENQNRSVQAVLNQVV